MAQCSSCCMFEVTLLVPVESCPFPRWHPLPSHTLPLPPVILVFPISGVGGEAGRWGGREAELQQISCSAANSSRTVTSASLKQQQQQLYSFFPSAPEWNYIDPRQKEQLDKKAEDGEFW